MNENENMGYMGHEEYGKYLQAPKTGRSPAHLSDGATAARGNDAYPFISRGGAGDMDRLGNRKEVALQNPNDFGYIARVRFLNNKNIENRITDVPAKPRGNGNILFKNTAESNRSPDY